MIRPKVLCVDDDAAFRELYRTLLESYGYEVVVAENGSYALRAFNSSSPDAVVLDHEMPAMNGSEVAAAMKSINPRVPIIMVSGSKSVVEEVPQFVDAAIGKGCDVSLLLDKLQLMVASGGNLSPAGRDRRFVPLGSALAMVALAAYLLPRLWR
jgi:CheY-like chemotaxis protein